MQSLYVNGQVAIQGFVDVGDLSWYYSNLRKACGSTCFSPHELKYAQRAGYITKSQAFCEAFITVAPIEGSLCLRYATWGRLDDAAKPQLKVWGWCVPGSLGDGVVGEL
jgi:hypothetical protein